MTIDTIVTDLDDTLLDGSGSITPFTLHVLRECMRRGVRVIPASGRTAPSMLSYLKQLSTGYPCIGGNGSQLISADFQVLEEIDLPPELARRICRFLQDEGFYVQFYHGEHFYYAAECETAKRFKWASGLSGVAVGDLLGYLTFPVPKLLSINEAAEVTRVLPLIQERFQGEAAFTMSKATFLECIPLGVSKGNALKRLAEQMGIAPERTLCFGDSLNDISLFSFTENSVAVGNARQETKDAARYVCGPNTEDGLARFVAKHVLKEAVS